MAEASAPDYAQIARETKETVLGHCKEDWPVVKNSGGVLVTSFLPPDCNWKIYKAEGEVDAAPSETLEYLIPGPGRVRGNWDPTVKFWEFLKGVSEDTCILRTASHSAAMGLISSRDYIDLITTQRNIDGKDTHITCGRTIDYSFPEDSSCVRGSNFPSGVVCRPVEGNPDKTLLTFVVHTDLKGMIPLKLIEATLPSVQVSFIGNVRKAIKNKLLDKHMQQQQ